MKSYYFFISSGLRGCYMPDFSYCVKVTTRRELKDLLQIEADSINDAGFIGCSKRSIARLANNCWKNREDYTLMDFVAPYRSKKQHDYPYGLFCSMARKQDYIDSLEE